MEVEEIPDADTVSRLVEFPRTYDPANKLILDAVFQFPNNEAESVIWRKYAPSDADVHHLGCAWETSKQKRNPDMRYVGFISAEVGAIRDIRSAKGHGFTVVHQPEEGVHHAGIVYAPAPGTPSLSKGEKGELKIALRGVFGSLAPHTCQAA